MFKTTYDAVEFGKRLKQLRKLNRMTQEKLAEELSVSVDSISKYENGRVALGHDHIMKLCVLFRVSADYFYFGIHKSIENEQWEDKIFSIIKEKEENEKQKAYEIIKLVFQ